MKKSVAYFFLTCSILLVLGHSLIPHNHVKNGRNAHELSATKDLSFSEIVKLALAHNLGSNHLEEFKKFEKSTITQKVSSKELNGITSQTNFDSSFSRKEKYLLLREIHYKDGRYLTNSQLRGPPYKA